MRKEERKERNDRQDTEKRKRRMEKKHMRDANGKPKLCKKKNGHKTEKKRSKENTYGRGYHYPQGKAHNITYNNTSTEQVTHLDVKQNVPGRVNKKPQG